MAVKPHADSEPPDPDRARSQRDFSDALTLAKVRAGLTVRQVARASGIPVSTLGDYFAGRHLPPPGPAGPLPSILAVLGIGDETEVGRWLVALQRVRRPPGRRPSRGAAPYRGLACFQPQDAAWFFGREELLLHLVRLASGVGATGVPIAVVGPSGSGKSSLLRAGLYPRLAAGPPARPQPRPVLLVTPGATPVAALAGALAAPLAASLAAALAPGTRVEPATLAADLRADPRRCADLAGRGESPPAIIVDQFEEVFTTCEDEAERQAFVAALTALSVTTLVVFALRADFYAAALRYPELAACLQDRQIVVGPMTADQLRRAITEPARKAGLEMEEGLADLLLRDMRPPAAHIPGPHMTGTPAAGAGGTGAGGTAAGTAVAGTAVAGTAVAGTGPAGHEAGTLPLLSHALLVTWERAAGTRLTVAGYYAGGGVHGAIAQSAEAAYGQLDEGSRALARQIFLRLVHVAGDRRETMARLPLAGLPEAGLPETGPPETGPPETGPPGAAGQPGAVPAVLERFVAQRLVTVDAGMAEITHEALLEAWPRLRAWLDADAEARRQPAAGEKAQHPAWQQPKQEQPPQERAEPEQRKGSARLVEQRRRLHRLIGALAALALITAALAGYLRRWRRTGR
jgi:transcriptional regulator with XRE-family HTH domain